VIARYSTPETDELFSERAKMTRWLEIELCVVEALADAGVVPKEAAASCRKNAPVIDDDLRARMVAAEELTDKLVAPAYGVLNAQERKDFLAGAQAIAAALAS
jgi:adenylosuccinate lyase